MDKNKRKKIIKRILLSLLAIGLLGGLILSGALIYEYYYHSYLPQKEFEKVSAQFNTSNDSTKLEIAKNLLKKEPSIWDECKVHIFVKVDSLRDQALEYIEEKALNGNLDCQLFLGRVYEFGDQLYHRVYKNKDKSIYWYKEAADNGDGYSCFRIGSAYYWGLGMNQDFRKAVKYLKKGADLNDATALAAYGDLFVEGVTAENPHEKLIPKDLEQAKYWWKKSLEQGNEMAKDRLQKVYN